MSLRIIIICIFKCHGSFLKLISNDYNFFVFFDRSLNMEQEQKNREREKQAANTTLGPTSSIWPLVGTESENGGNVLNYMAYIY